MEFDFEAALKEKPEETGRLADNRGEDFGLPDRSTGQATSPAGIVEPGVEGAEATPVAPQSITLKVPSFAAFKPAFDKYVKEIEAWEVQVRDLVVKDEKTRDFAITVGGLAQKLKVALKAKRDEYWKPFLKFRDELDAFVGNFTSRLEGITLTTKEKQRPYDAKIQLARLEQEKASKEATQTVQEQVNQKAKELGIDPPKVDAPIIPKAKTKVRASSGITSYQHKEWKVEVTDESKLARKFLSADMKKIENAVKEGLREKMPDSDGLKIWEETTTRYR